MRIRPLSWMERLACRLACRLSGRLARRPLAPVAQAAQAARRLARQRPVLVPIAVAALTVGGVALARAALDGGGPAYLTVPVERGDLVTVVTATGTLEAVVTVRVGSQLSGQVADLLADFNDEVARGQPLARLDPQSFAARVREAEAALAVALASVRIREAAIDRAAADLANARAGRTAAEAQVASARVRADEAGRDLERKRTLLRRGTVAEGEVDRALAAHEAAAATLRAAAAERGVRDAMVRAAEAGLRMAEAELENARAATEQRRAALDQTRLDLERTVVRAPIDGVVIGRAVDRGQTVAASLEAPTLFTLAQDLRRMAVHARVDEADIGHIRPGQRVAFTVDAHPGRTFTGAVVQVRKAPEVMQGVVTYTVLVSADNPDLLLLPGMTAVARIVVEEVRGVLKVPNAALRFRPPPGGAGAGAVAAEADGAATGVVWLRQRRGELLPVPVRLGAGDATATEVVSGPLREGQTVIVGIAGAGRDGAPWLGIRRGP